MAHDNYQIALDFHKRYDVFYLESVLEPIGSPKKLYKDMAMHVSSVLPSCTVEDFFFETEPEALRHEMMKNSAEHPEGPLVGLLWEKGP